MTFWNFTRKDPAKDIEKLGEQLQKSLGPRLRSFISFGSVARGEYDPKRSNVNVLVVADLSPEGLKALSPAIGPWLRKGYTLPVLVEPDDLDDFARDFPVEFLDIKASYRVVRGHDVLAALNIRTEHLESQIEHDLAVLQLSLRQSLLAWQGKERPLQRILIRGCNSTGVLIQAARHLGKEIASELDKMQALDKLKDVRGLQDPEGDAVSRLLDLIGKLLTLLRSR